MHGGGAPAHAHRILATRKVRQVYAPFLSLEYDPVRPWIVVGDIRHLTVELEDGASFSDWAAREWPIPRYEVQADPWQTSPES